MSEDIHNQQNGGSEDPAAQPCDVWQPLLTLAAAGEELEPAEQARLAEHLAQCAECSASLVHEKELLATLAAHREEPDAALLAACRAGLEDALDREEDRGWLRRTFLPLLPVTWLSPRPAWSAAVLVLIGFSIGLFGPRLLLRRAAPPQVAHSGANSAQSDALASLGVSASGNSPDDSASSALDLRTADVAAINVLPSAGSAPPRVELRLRSQQPVTVEGSADEGDVKNALLYVLTHSERFCPDVRLGAVDALGPCINDPDVRSALCRAVRRDRNAAVRLKALEALDGAGPQDIIRDTLLDALVGDQNPGVRVEAINALRDMAARGEVPSDDHMLSVLQERMQKDPNAYVRIQSAAVVRDLEPGEK